MQKNLNTYPTSYKKVTQNESKCKGKTIKSVQYHHKRNADQKHNMIPLHIH